MYTFSVVFYKYTLSVVHIHCSIQCAIHTWDWFCLAQHMYVLLCLHRYLDIAQFSLSEGRLILKKLPLQFRSFQLQGLTLNFLSVKRRVCVAFGPLDKRGGVVVLCQCVRIQKNRNRCSAYCRLTTTHIHSTTCATAMSFSSTCSARS